MSQITILIAEDEAIFAEDLSGKLAQFGYAVAGITAEGEEAVEMALRLKPQLILMDINLQGRLDGIEAAKAIRSRFEVPVIYLTAHSDATTLARAKLTEPFGYIIKPVDERDLATQIELALHKHQSEIQLRESELRYRNLFQNNPAVLLLIEPRRGKIMDANPAACAYYGYTHDAITKLRIAAINTLETDRIHLAMQSAKSGQRSHFFFSHRMADGQIRDVEVFTGPITIAGRELLYSIVHDVTDRKRAEEALRLLNATLEQQVAERTQLAETRAKHLQALAVELIQAEERERQRIATLLHDDLQQLLACARMQLQATAERIPSEPVLYSILEMLTDAISKSRSLSHELSPVLRQHSELDVGLKRLAGQMSDQFGLQVQLELQTVPSITSELMKAFVLRGVRELLFNVVKHAGVKSARVCLSESNGYLAVEVSDKGRGFDPTILGVSNPAAGMGLLSLRQRARYIRGDLVIESAPGNGSRFILTVPVDLDDSDTLSRSESRVYG